MHCIVFCIHLVVFQSYLSLFSYIPCIHFAKLSTQFDLKIDWLIFESFVHFSICYFSLCVNYIKYFSYKIWWIINVQIFSQLMQLFMGHIVSCLHLLKEKIFFFMCILNLVFQFGLCLFIYPHLLNFFQNFFSQNLFCFSYFYRGRNFFLTFVVHRGSCLYFL